MSQQNNSRLRSLFTLKTNDNVSQPQVNIDPDAKQQGETYKNYGTRMAGLLQGSIYALQTMFHAVLQSLKKDQAQNIALQTELIEKYQNILANLKSQKQAKEKQQGETEQSIEEIKKRLGAKQKELDELESRQYKRNQSAWRVLIISGLLLIPFTIYFFIFYSSVGYTAFFFDANVEELLESSQGILARSIFSATALGDAWNTSFTEFLFIILLPIIFLAFGFVLNRWEKEKGKLKYVKIPAIVLLAFVFDALLAFHACEKIYDIHKQMIDATTMEGSAGMPDYTLSMAFSDPNFWLIIFLGFISYLIWGVTFGIFVNAWDSLDLNAVTKKQYGKDIEDLEKQLSTEKQNREGLIDQIQKLESQIILSQKNAQQAVAYDYNAIKLELSNFHTGWQVYLSSVSRPDSDKDKAQDVYNSFIKSIDSQIS